jgi:hypothetical protein
LSIQTNFKHPRNETETHFLLKEIAKYILFGWGYNRIGTEVNSMQSYEFREKGKDFKSVIDAVGVKRCRQKKLINGESAYYYDVKGIESKATLSDFKNGFCVAPMYTYIIAPINTIPIELIPDKIGFIEVDLEKFQLPKNSQNIPDMKGVQLTKRASKRLDSRFKTEEVYRKWCLEVLDDVAYRSTSELLFWRNYIEFSKK